MSYSVTAIVRNARLPRSMKRRPECQLVALSLADRADDDGGNAWPSVATIAGESQIGTRTADVCLQTLRDAGLIREQRPPRQRMPRTWLLNLDAWRALAPQHAAGLDASATQHAAGLSSDTTSDPQNRALGSQDTSLDPQNRALGSQHAADDPVLRSGPFDPVPLNGRSLSQKEKAEAFELAKAIARPHLEARPAAYSAEAERRQVLMAVLAEIKATGKHVDERDVDCAIEHWVTLHQMRQRFGQPKAATA